MPTVIYAHGFKEKYEHESVQTVRNAYLKRGGWNVIVINYAIFADGCYMEEATPRLQMTGFEVAKYLKQFIDAGYPSNKIHLIGHSMGGQLVGLIARQLKAISNKEYVIDRVTGLDPAGPGFDPLLPGSFQPLNKNDA